MREDVKCVEIVKNKCKNGMDVTRRWGKGVYD